MDALKEWDDKVKPAIKRLAPTAAIYAMEGGFDPATNMFSLWVMTTAETKADALTAAKVILREFTEGRKHYVRAAPEVDEQTDFLSGEHMIRGYVRFALWDEPGSEIPLIREPDTFAGFAKAPEAQLNELRRKTDGDK